MFRKITLTTFVIFGLAGVLVVTDAMAQSIRVIGGRQARAANANQSITPGQGCGVGAGACNGAGQGQQRGCRGMGFVDADEDGINDSSPLAQLELTDAQKAEIVALRESIGRGNPQEMREAVAGVLTEDQTAQLQAIRAERQANCPNDGQGCGQGRGRSQCGKGFVDADEDGINDRSPLAQLNLTDEQKAQFTALRESIGRGNPQEMREAVAGILTEEQNAQLDAMRAERQADCPHSGQGRRMGRGKGARQFNAAQ